MELNIENMKIGKYFGIKSSIITFLIMWLIIIPILGISKRNGLNLSVDLILAVILIGGLYFLTFKFYNKYNNIVIFYFIISILILFDLIDSSIYRYMQESLYEQQKNDPSTENFIITTPFIFIGIMLYGLFFDLIKNDLLKRKENTERNNIT